MTRIDLPIVLAAASRHIGKIIARRANPLKMDRMIAFESIRLTAGRHSFAKSELAAALSEGDPAEVSAARRALADPAEIPFAVRETILRICQETIDRHDEDRKARIAYLSAQVLSDEEISSAMDRAQRRLAKAPSTDYQRAAWAAFERARTEGVDTDNPSTVALLSYLVAKD